MKSGGKHIASRLNYAIISEDIFRDLWQAIKNTISGSYGYKTGGLALAVRIGGSITEILAIGAKLAIKRIINVATV